MKKVYLAGPDVFASDAAERAEQHKSLCRMHGFEPLHPVDQVEPTAQSIYQHNVELIQQADAVIANANPFRGAEPDSGTVFEIGYAVAWANPSSSISKSHSPPLKPLKSSMALFTTIRSESNGSIKAATWSRTLTYPSTSCSASPVRSFRVAY